MMIALMVALIVLGATIYIDGSRWARAAGVLLSFIAFIALLIVYPNP